jgi:phospholipase/lecithinase/hemolysin
MLSVLNVLFICKNEGRTMYNTIRFRKFSLLTPSTLILTLVFTFAATAAYAKDYAHIVVFGDSLSDTGNVAHLSYAKYGFRMPGPAANYTDGRFTSGIDTVPPAKKYFGVWIEQLAASMPLHPQVKNSLDGGTNYAYGFAFTGNGTTTLTFGAGDVFSVDVENMGQQITHYLGTKPTIDSNTLFVIWGGANNLNYANSVNDVVNAAIEETLDIQRLIDAGATQFLVLNLPPMGLIPRLNGSPATSLPANAAAALFNSWLDSGISVLHDSYGNRHLTFFCLDVYSLFNQIVTNPGKFGFANISSPSQNANLVNPDTYLFWDDLHPTAKGHSILAGSAMKAMTLPQCTSYGLSACAAAVSH